MDFSTYFTGMIMGLTLIVAIGAQNAFVLRQGLYGHHVLAVCLACAISDALLILLGVLAFGKIAAVMPTLEPIMRYAGAAFLLWYGAKSLRSALGPPQVLAAASGSAGALSPTLLTCLALTWLNPHVYLDTVILLGSLSTQFPGAELAFAAGAITASFAFFFLLGYGAAFARPIFANPLSWRVLDGAIALVMGSIALTLLIGG